MELLFNDTFWMIATVLVTGLGVHYAGNADRRKERQETEKRLADQISGLKQDLTDQISGLKQELTDQKQELKEQKQDLDRRIDRLEDRVHENQKEATENHKEATAAISALTSAITALSTKLDERSFPRRLEGPVPPGARDAPAPLIGVREKPARRYSTDEPKEKEEEAEPKGEGSPD